MIHIDKGGNKEATKWFLDHLAQYHVPFDVLGQSFYPWWHGSLDDLKDNLAFTWNTYHKDVVVVETAYDWRTGEDFKDNVAPFPETPEGQRDFLAALDRVVRKAPGGKMRGIFWWELWQVERSQNAPCSTTSMRRFRRSMCSTSN